MPATSLPTVPVSDSPGTGRLWPMAMTMAAGVFATTFVQIQGLGALPLNSLLMKQMGLNSNEAATFMSLVTLPWTFKVVAGLLVDGVPLFGSRRRAYLLASAIVAVVMWLAMAAASFNRHLLLVAALGMNTALVFGSTTAGGLLVEAGQRFNASGKLSSLRAFAQNLGAAVSMPLGGYLAGHALGWTSAVAAVPLSGMFLATWCLLREPRLPSVRNGCHSIGEACTRVLRSIGRQLGNVLRVEMLMPALLLFFIQAVPTFRSTSFYEYQTKSLGYSDEVLGWLGLAGLGAALLGPGAYALVCRKLPLRVSLHGAIGLTAASCVPYLFYPAWNGGGSLAQVLAIEAVGSFLMYLAYVPLFDLAVRSTPKGSEALGFSLLISIWNIGLMIGGKAGPWIYQHGVEQALAAMPRADQLAIRHQEMNQLIWLNAGVTLLGIVIVSLIPAVLVDRREEQGPPASPQ
jgi:MFS family permease